MRIITVRPPWAHAIVRAGKDVENRSTNLAGSYRGPVAIHVAKAEDVSAIDYPVPHPITGVIGGLSIDPRVYADRGMIIGVVDLVDVHLGSSHPDACWHDTRGLQPRCSPWGDEGSYHLMLANPRALVEPIPFTGALGLRTLDDATVALIEAQLS